MFVVAGVTGNTGRVVAETLLKTGHPVRVLVRSPDAAKGWSSQGAEAQRVDLADQNALTAALRGAQGAYLLVPPHYGPDILKSQAAVARSIASALKDAQLPRAVLLSSIGAQHLSGTGPIRAVHRLEQEAQGIAGVTFLRAAYFLENWLHMAKAAKGGSLPSFLPPGAHLPMVATRDIGEAAAALLTQAEAPPPVIELSGPTDPSDTDIAADFSQVFQTQVSAVNPPLEDVAPAFASAGVPEELGQLYEEMYRGIKSGRVAFEAINQRRGTTPFSQLLANAAD